MLPMLLALSAISPSTPDLVERAAAQLYERVAYRAIWFVDRQPAAAALDAIELLRSAGDEGLDPHDYGVEKIDRLLEELVPQVGRLDVAITRGMIAYALDRRGRFDRTMAKARKISSVELEGLLDRFELATRRGGLPALVHTLSLRSAQELALIDAFKEARALRKSSDARRIALNLERMRAISGESAPLWILINIPSRELIAYEHDRPVLAMTVIVGNKQKPTPRFDSAITQVTLNPQWAVPDSIAYAEVWPRIMREPSYRENFGFRILHREEGQWIEVDPFELDLARVDLREYALRQEPGELNALGRIKLSAPNPYRVYLHDTPARKAFARPDRNFSHGCIRLEQPLELTSLTTGIDLDELQSMLDRGQTKTISIPKPVPIHVVYWTVTADAERGVEFHSDLYRLDRRQLRHLPPVPEATTPTEPEAPEAQRPAVASAREPV